MSRRTPYPIENLHVHFDDRAYWHAMNAARQQKFCSILRDRWVSDNELGQSLKTSGDLIWQERRDDHASHELVIQTDSAVIACAKSHRIINCSIFARNLDDAKAELDVLRKFLPTAERQEKLLDVTFWYNTINGPRRIDRQLQVPNWQDIAINYPADTRGRLEQLQTVRIEDGSGRLILWQGEPGTGKTFALRALAEEWASWCQLHYVLDSEKFFSEGQYLFTVILGEDESHANPAKPLWRLVVLEDAGELIAKDARLQAGQGLSRLLNLTAGLLGQGLKVLVLITTNEEMGSLNDAVSRPGRCLSQIEFQKFDAKSANQWLRKHKSDASVIRPSTLAELYAITQGTTTQEPERQVVGFK